MTAPTVDHTMQVEQAIFASSDRSSIKGYHLVAQSAGVDSEQAFQLTRWAPTQLPEDAPPEGAISCWTMDDETVVLTRTLFAGAEYSDRGGRQVMTLALLLRDAQFRAYDCQPISLWKTAFALGQLRLPRDSYRADLNRTHLPAVTLPDRSLFPSMSSPSTDSLGGHSFAPTHGGLINEIVSMIERGERFALIGSPDPLAFVTELMNRLSIDQRHTFSFTSGLSPSIRRPLQAHFFRHPNAERLQTLQSRGISCLDLNARPVAKLMSQSVKI
jgi:hypothetical protein